MDEYPGIPRSGEPEQGAERTLAAFEGLLRNEELWVAVPADLERRVLQAIDLDQPVLGLAGRHVASTNGVVRRTDKLLVRRLARSRRVALAGLRRPALVAAAAAAIAAAGIGINGFAGSGTRTIALAGTALASDATAQVELKTTSSGVEIRMDAKGLPPAPAGSYYEGWVKGERGIVAIGTFHLRDGSDQIVLWSGVELVNYPTIAVTVQKEGAGANSSGRVVLSGVVPPADR
jgi:hypothetical protein